MLIPFWNRWSVEERCYVFDIESAWTYKFQELFTRNSVHCSHFFIFLEKNQQKKEKDDFHWNPHSVNRADCSLNVDSFQMKRTNFMWIGWMFRFHTKKIDVGRKGNAWKWGEKIPAPRVSKPFECQHTLIRFTLLRAQTENGSHEKSHLKCWLTCRKW